MELRYKNKDMIFRENEKQGVLYLTYPLFEELQMVKHGFSTRIGGVSTGVCESMNLSFSRGDSEDAVRENFRRITHAIGVCEEDLVFSVQTHTSNVRKVTKEDRGKGFLYPVDYQDVDGLVTDEKDVCLATFYADCVPLFFVDPVRGAIGLCHSGWRGTVEKIGKKTVERMTGEYGCRPENIRAAVGPSICQDCYEVSADVIEKFKANYDSRYWEELFYEKPDGKYQLNLWKAQEIVFQEAGILKKNTAVTNLCTCCNPQMLFSHRASHGRRGNLGAFLALK